MADNYWRYDDGDQQAAELPSPVVERPRSVHDIPSGPYMSGYYARDEDRERLPVSALYGRYLDRAKMSSHASGSGRPMRSGLGGHHHVNDPRVLRMGGPPDPEAAAKIWSMGAGGRPKIPLPVVATSTLFVLGVPANCTRREASHIFRPFVGYKEVRLIPNTSKCPGGDPSVLCFVDFDNPALAETAMAALQGWSYGLGPFYVTQSRFL
ncbi:hypothetical protein AAHA92_18601 [Salvia divinorum]|uniref:RRM domain-containing protein n=1 Tax=Salvia divinorum TaxID=28513 RepID=A0ABD1H340_SALDI